MAITLSNLLARVKHLRPDLHGGEQLYALQIASRRVGTECPVKQVEVSLNTVAGQNVYDVTLPAPSAEGQDEEVLRIAYVKLPDGSYLREANSQETFSATRHGLQLGSGYPRCWMDRFGTLIFDPIPDQILAIAVGVFVLPTIGAEIVDMPNAAVEAIVSGASYELMLIPGEGFTPAMVSLWAHRSVKELGNYKAKVDFGTSGQPTMHIVSPYTARVRRGGTGGYMV